MPRYDFENIEKKWQKAWQEKKAFRSAGPGEPGFDAAKPKYYILDMFPYPSGDGLHVGHPKGYIATDILARYKRMRGFNVLHPMGWDSFGLPAEQYAIKTGQHPAVTTAKNIRRFREQINLLGFSYDWQREIATSEPAYYRWTQWIFKRLFEKGLAYQAEVPVWWCDKLGTVLANEEVDAEGNSHVGGYPCVRRKMRQWMLKITAYAQRLLDDLEGMDWPAGIKKMQADWIGRSEGADVVFTVADGPAQGEPLEVFTTRPDTLYGATYMVLAPEHPLTVRLTTPAQKKQVEEYVAAAGRKSELERQAEAKVKSGVFTGSYALNPVNGKAVPVWVADYVLISYGTGAIMAVPAHDQRDYDFAVQMKLPIVRVVQAPATYKDGGCFAGDGVAINSGPLDGLPTASAKAKITAQLEEKKQGRKVVRFKLRDWLFSRQRYWGEPFPVYFDKDGKPVLVKDEELPVTLPEMESYKPSGSFEAPLSRVGAWVDTPLGKRETNVMPQWAGSCWYYLRFLDPQNDARPFGPEKEKYWMPVDLYVGGAEHAVLHLLYARFWHKVLYDLGLVTTKEPFQRLFNQGMVMATSYRTATGTIIRGDLVKWAGDQPTHPETGEALEIFTAKMSKSLGNVVNPDEIAAQYGADSLRLYEMFMGPLDQGILWDSNGIQGVFRFLKRVWHLVAGEEHDEQACRPELLKPGSVSKPELDKVLHRCLKAVTSHLEAMRFNVGIAAMMTLLNEIGGEALSRAQAEMLVKMLCPFAPHLAEELWGRLGHAGFAVFEAWPIWDEKLCQDEIIELVVQVNGKVRCRVSVPRQASEADIKAAALADARIKEILKGKEPKKIVVVPGKLVSLVV